MDQSDIGRWIVRLDGYNNFFEHRTRNTHQNANSFSKKTKFYERQDQMKADRPEIKNGLPFVDNKTYDSLPLTRWVDKSRKPIEDHPEEPIEHRETEILGRRSRMPVEILLKSKLGRETLNTKGCVIEKIEKERAVVG